MAIYEKFNQTVENLAHGVHNFTNDTTCTLTLALTAAVNAPVAANSVLADLTPIVYTNLSGDPGSRVVSVNSSSQAGGIYTLTVNDITLTAAGGAMNAFQYVVVYDDDPTSPIDPLICFFDYGSELTLQDGESLTVDFGSDGPTTGTLFTLT